MGKLETLSEEQISLMITVRQEWLDRIFGCKTKIDKQKATEAIKWLYKSSKLEEPAILFVSSPLAAQYAHNMIRATQQNVQQNVRQNVLKHVEKNVWQNIQQNVWHNIQQNVGDNVWQNVQQNVQQNVWQNIQQNVWHNVGYNVQYNVWDNVWENVGHNVWENELKYERFSSYGNVSDYGWVAFYDFFQRIGIIQHEGFTKFKTLLESGIYDMIQLEGLCIVCEMPNKILRNDAGRLHATNQSAISWEDGYELYFWNGVTVSEKLIKTPHLITREDIIAETNAERRRCIREKLGDERFSDLLGLIEIDSDIDEQGHTMFLFKTQEIDTIINDHIYFYRGTCPSTLRVYTICVRPCTNVWQAKASTFKRNKETYHTTIET